MCFDYIRIVERLFPAIHPWPCVFISGFGGCFLFLIGLRLGDLLCCFIRWHRSASSWCPPETLTAASPSSILPDFSITFIPSFFSLSLEYQIPSFFFNGPYHPNCHLPSVSPPAFLLVNIKSKVAFHSAFPIGPLAIFLNREKPTRVHRVECKCKGWPASLGLHCCTWSECALPDPNQSVADEQKQPFS